MRTVKEDLIEILEEKNLSIENFRATTFSCITNVMDIEDDIEKGNKYIEYISLRQTSLDEVEKFNNIISENDEMDTLYNSEDVDVLEKREKYKKIYQEIEKMQPKMDEIGQSILSEMRGEFKKIKQEQNFSNHYFNSPYTSGTVFDAQQ